MHFLSAKRIAPDGTPRFAASHLGLFCLPMSHKKDTRCIWVKNSENIQKKENGLDRSVSNNKLSSVILKEVEIRALEGTF